MAYPTRKVYKILIFFGVDGQDFFIFQRQVREIIPLEEE